MSDCLVCGEDSGKSGNFRLCRRCMMVRQRYKKKQDLLDYGGGKCQRCGYNRCNRALAFHHIDPKQKDFNISRDFCKSTEKLKKEIDKCVLLCHNCHAEEHDKIEKEKLWHSKERWIQYELAKAQDKPKKINISGPCKHCGKQCFGKLQCCSYCYSNIERCSITWPSDEELKKLVFEKPIKLLAIDLKVSDNAIRKRCIKRNIQIPKKGFWLKSENKVY